MIDQFCAFSGGSSLDAPKYTSVGVPGMAHKWYTSTKLGLRLVRVVGHLELIIYWIR